MSNQCLFDWKGYSRGSEAVVMSNVLPDEDVAESKAVVTRNDQSYIVEDARLFRPNAGAAILVQARILDDRELMAVASKKEELRFGVDSGAALTVVRSDVATDYPVMRERKRSLRTADGQSIPDLGNKEIMLKDSYGYRIVKTAVADVSRNLRRS